MKVTAVLTAAATVAAVALVFLEYAIATGYAHAHREGLAP